MWNDLWKVWRHVAPREAIFVTAIAIFSVTMAIHFTVLGNDRYAAALIGG